MDKLAVKVDGKYVGNIIKENDEYIFDYVSEKNDDFISLIMPVRAKNYIHNKLHPIFEMHLPEGYLLSIIKKHFSKILKTDDFGLLKVMSPSIKGRLSYEMDANTKDDALYLEDLLHPKSEKLFDELVSRFALSSALSGVQPKVLATIRNKATLKLDDYIVKSWGEEYKELALNEYYCMQVVRGADIAVPEFFISDDEKLFIMKRFDIVEENRYLGFEDMCVLLGKQRDDKYDGTYEQIAKTIKIFVSNKHKKNSLKNFFKMTVINFLVQNGDAHLKNFGLVYDGIEDIRLAPAYDVVCTTLYIKDDIPALHLLGSKKWWDKKYLLRFGVQSCDLTQSEVESCFEMCVNSLKTVLKEIKQRELKEQDKDKKEILNILIERFQQYKN
ncbi:type II toxin-antitoxin system HipA family toxin [Arcobacter caeni]|uniref:Phosphatidylinositol kinase n=1 Tax=Arcobacter caeni TaxID=1912877 RepID=A0A363CW64_9BACT|nr:type II toxin-antitoxin system HipA family toxin [Arcobacter caeni]PUE63340.1 phosphatidylinositol kinase [Arcobacter caeni]